MAFWNDLFKLWNYSREKPLTIKDIAQIPDLPPVKHKTILLVDDDWDQTTVTPMEFRKADYVITRSGKVLKTRDGTMPVTVVMEQPPKSSRYRSIDDP